MAEEVTATHPEYDEVLPDWGVIRDAILGETTVKGKTTTYLPMPSGFKVQSDGGAEMYAAYSLRAQFPEIMGPTIRGMVGIVHRIEADITLPKVLEPLREAATKDGLPLTAVHERITYELLATGRYGLLVDAPEVEGGVPYLAGYRAETLINWSDDQDFYVLDETHLERVEFEWDEVEQYRVLELVGSNGSTPMYQQRLYKADSQGNISDAPEVILPRMKGAGVFAEIPFVVIGSTDVTPEVDEVPLLSVGRCAFNMYRLDADYKWQLFMSGQETLFVSSDSETDVTTVGAGVVVNLPAGSEANYVGPSGQGIEAHKTAIEDQREQALIAGARIFDTTKKTAESGEALKMRWTAQTASLTTIAINSAKGLEKCLKYAALFMGANPDEVVVKPNLRFIDSTLDPLKAKALMEMWFGGAISGQTLWENLQKGDIGTYDRTWEEEKDLIDEEMPDIPQGNANVGGQGGGAPGQGQTPPPSTGSDASRFIETGENLNVE